MQVVVVGIGTDVGKTVVSAILVEKYNSAYWKPIQAGELENSDSMKVAALAPSCSKILPELFRLNTPASPHYAAQIDGVAIQKDVFILPQEPNLVIEAAGGLMVPFNDTGDLYLDLLVDWKLPVVLVSRHYLGSINHTLLSLEILKQREIPLQGVVFVGEENVATEAIIRQLFPEVTYARIPLASSVTSNFVSECASQIGL